MVILKKKYTKNISLQVDTSTKTQLFCLSSWKERVVQWGRGEDFMLRLGKSWQKHFASP